ncbi:MAG: O-antigen ligase family protein [Thermodesulfovibrionia bacterium]|nr:O-antigen ligase family protein [Thermodesulfovibrionia bacterium]
MVNISNIKSWILKHSSLVIAVFISYLVSLLLLDNYAYVLVGAVVVVLVAIFIRYPRAYVYFIVTTYPIMGILQEFLAFRVGGLYTGFNLGGVFVAFGVLYGVIYMLLKRPRIFKYELTIPILIFFGIVTLSLTYIEKYKFFAFRDIIRLSTHMPLYFIILDNFKDMKDAKKLLAALTSVFVPMFIYFVAVIYFPSLGGNIMRNMEAEISSEISMPRLGGFLHATSIGSYIVIFFVISIYYYYQLEQKDRWKCYVMFVMLPFLLFNALARNAWITFVFVLIVVGILRYRKLVVVFVLACIFVLMIRPDVTNIIWLRMQPDPSSNYRLILNKLGWALFVQKPILGWGQAYVHIYTGENISSSINQYGVGGVDLHNEYLRIMIETGIVGLLSYLYLMYKGAKMSFKLFRLPQSIAKDYALVSLTVIISVMINGATGQGFRDMAIYFWIFMAICEAYLINLRSQAQDTQNLT